MQTRNMNLAAAAVLAGAMVMAGCSQEKSEAPGGSAAARDKKPVVYTSNYPVAYFAERIAGDLAEVVLPVPEDEDPAFWQPAAEHLRGFQNADMILFNGATYEKWAAVASLPSVRIVQTSSGFRDSWIEIEDAVTHSHGPGEEHTHAGTDYNTWVDPRQAIQQAEAIHAAFVRLMPASEATLTANMEALRNDLTELDTTLSTITSANPGKPILGSHPVFNYLARRYSLNMRSVHWEAEEFPDEDGITELRDTQDGHNAEWMLWEAKPEDEIVELLKTHGVHSVDFYLLGNAPEEGDYLSVMRENADRLRAVYTE